MWNTDSCMTLRVFHVQFTKHQLTCQHTLLTHGVTIDLQHGTLDHAIEHGRSRASTCH